MSTAVVRRPSPALADGLVGTPAGRRADPGLARAQHAAYVRLLRELDWRVVELPERPEHPDGVFVEDVAVSPSPGVVAVTRPGAVERRGETTGVAEVLAGLGLDVREMRRGRLDGGDVLALGGVLYVGQSARTDAEGVAELARLVEGLVDDVVPVPVERCLHLKSGLGALPGGGLVTYPPLVDPGPVLDGPVPPTRVIQAPEATGANVALLGDIVLAPASAPRTVALLRAADYDVRVLDISEFELLEGGLTCLSIRLEAH